jgi:hypothetical protein
VSNKVTIACFSIIEIVRNAQERWADFQLGEITGMKRKKQLDRDVVGMPTAVRHVKFDSRNLKPRPQMLYIT